MTAWQPSPGKSDWRVDAARKIILTGAATGSVRTPSVSPRLPLTPDQIAKTVIETGQAGP
ncbi:3-keto-5-aminohexanoate cleavage protein [Maliponia aquimaris]|uniref:3-keto-5-aminohexanoate cleavage protein n=1 Tax=Maliponia aquimaris TaxID=1673631 RepID=UPI001C3D7181